MLGFPGRRQGVYRIGLVVTIVLWSSTMAISGSATASNELLPQNSVESGPFLGNGVKIGEADQTHVILWARLTKNRNADFSRLPILKQGLPPRAKSSDEMPTEVHPGHPGEVQVTYWKKKGPGSHSHTMWRPVDPDKDHTVQIRLTGLDPGTEYEYLVTARRGKNSDVSDRVTGSFWTAPDPQQRMKVRFIVSTCQAIRSIDSGTDGHVAYRNMLKFQPHFFVHTGDILYYDKAPFSRNVAQARAKWNLMFSYRFNRAFHQQVTSYFMKDDHDTLKNDCWPGQKYGDLTFDQGLQIFREQVCMGEKTYRTIRWGKDLQIWLTENRDFRSANRVKDGPEKTILGAIQKSWLKKTIAESDATFRFVITPGPIVGPDKKGKADNHSNANFMFEGQELRDFLSKQKNLYVICGDRHWQYCSTDPKTSLLEMGCGPINDEHSFGGNPGFQPEYHRYFSGKGGFLGITVDGNKAMAQWFSASEMDPKTGKPVVRFSLPLPVDHR